MPSFHLPPFSVLVEEGRYALWTCASCQIAGVSLKSSCIVSSHSPGSRSGAVRSRIRGKYSLMPRLWQRWLPLHRLAQPLPCLSVARTIALTVCLLSVDAVLEGIICACQSAEQLSDQDARYRSKQAKTGEQGREKTTAATCLRSNCGGERGFDADISPLLPPVCARLALNLDSPLSALRQQHLVPYV